MHPGRRSVTFLCRKQSSALFSIERVFSWVGAALAGEREVTYSHAPHESRGLLPRLRNGLWAMRQRRELIHVTGDVNYLTIVLRGRRVVQTIHDVGTWRRLRGFRKWLFERLWIVWPIRASMATTVVSDFTRAELATIPGVDAQKLVVVPNPVDPSLRFDPKIFDAQKPRILLIGTTPNKNLERVFAALAGISCELVVVGKLTAAQTAQIGALNLACSNVVGLSPEAMSETYRRCDLMLFASTYEGFGLPIVEAQAVGRPVVTSRNSSMPDVAGEGAILVDPFDVASIRKGVVAVIEDAPLRERLIEAGRRNVERFRVDAVARQYARLYDSIP